jgi:elongation factor 2
MPMSLWQHKKINSLVMSIVQVYPEKGTAAFSAGLHGWAFTLSNFAKMYAFKFGVDESKMMKRLWGENYFDPSTKKWSSKHTGSATCKRGFVQFCYEPIKQIINSCMNDQKSCFQCCRS